MFKIDTENIITKQNEDRISLINSCFLLCLFSNSFNTCNKRTFGSANFHKELSISIHSKNKWKSNEQLITKTSKDYSIFLKMFLVSIDFDQVKKSLFRGKFMKKIVSNAFIFSNYSKCICYHLCYFQNLISVDIEINNEKIFINLNKLEHLSNFCGNIKSYTKMKSLNFNKSYRLRKSFLDFFSKSKLNFTLKVEYIPEYFILFKEIQNPITLYLFHIFCDSLYLMECFNIIESLYLQSFNNFFTSNSFAKEIRNVYFKAALPVDVCLFFPNNCSYKTIKFTSSGIYDHLENFVIDIITSSECQEVVLDFTNNDDDYSNLEKNKYHWLQQKFLEYYNLIDSLEVKEFISVKNFVSLQISECNNATFKLGIIIIKSKKVKSITWKNSTISLEDVVFPFEDFFTVILDENNYESEKVEIKVNLRLGSLTQVSNNLLVDKLLEKNIANKFFGYINIYEFKYYEKLSNTKNVSNIVRKNSHSLSIQGSQLENNHLCLNDKMLHLERICIPYNCLMHNSITNYEYEINKLL